MGAVAWTPEQLCAIESRNGTLLVSAAAGSGKTAVLVERLLRRVQEEGIPIDRFLMITYTNAAASELRAKIIDAISQKIAENPADRHMAKQMTYVHRAQISTIHAYCTQVLRTHGHLLGICDHFKIMDEREAEILRRQALDDLLEEEYDAGTPAFFALCDALSGERDDRKMVETILTLHGKSRSHPDPEKWLARCCAAYKIDEKTRPEETLWGAGIIAHIHEICHYLIQRLEHVIDELSSDSALEAAYGPVLRADISNLQRLCCESQWDKLVQTVNTMEFMRLTAVRKCEDPQCKEWAKEERNDVKKEILKICERLLCKDSQTIYHELCVSAPIAAELCRLVSALDSRYGESKRARDVLDYGDLEHFAVRLLVEHYSEEEDIVVPTVLAREISGGFCEIMVDEYQDSNCIQDIIFRAISSEERNLTMVGDLKQSIYRFRLADPTIFLRKYKAFTEYQKAKPGEPRVVNLSKNFRSRSEVLQSCNRFFALTMSERLGELNYTEREFLNPGAVYPDNPADNQSELVVLDLAEEKEQTEGELPPHAREVEARYIAARIQKMVREHYPLSDHAMGYGDVVILLRSMAGRAEIYERVLREYGIPCVSDQNEGLLGTVEIGIMISFLQTIDNPLWDVPLVSTLRSPMFGFTADDLAAIRRQENGFFYDALIQEAKKEDECGGKCRAFLKVLSGLRDLASELPTDELIWRAMDQTGARGLFGAMEQGELRIAHLLALHQYAQRFESGGFRGLHAFLNHIAQISEQGGDIAAGRAESSSDAVKIMSIHKSKGLEFPVVFLADCNRRFNKIDLQQQVLTHPTLGLGLTYRDQDLRYECPTLARMCITLALEREMKSEELRVLYVAMTRAKEKLIAVCTEQNAARRMEKAERAAHGGTVSPIALLHAYQADLWFMLPQCAQGDVFSFALVNKDSIPEPEGYGAEMGETCHAENWRTEELGARFSYRYPYESAVTAEGKLTATGISKEGIAKRKHLVRPRFAQERGLTPTERGIALHLAMQLVRFDQCTTGEGIRKELLRLREQEFLTPEQAEVIAPEKLEAFFRSETGRDALRSPRIWRELHFSRLIPISEEDTALLQGVVDLVFEKDGSLVVVDFKSDRRIDEQAVAQYTRQLTIYTEALETMIGKPVSARILFFLNHGATIVC